MRVIVGLGNIGKEFERTNHNMGFRVIDRVANKLNISIKKNMCNSLVGEGNQSGEKVLLVKPTTYMNASGIAIKSLVNKFNIDINKDIIIISDDIDLPIGNVRLREKGSAGTHNGLRSIVRELGRDDFPRLRIGIGRPNEHEDLADFVLSAVRNEKDLQQGLEKGEEACLMFLEGKDFPSIMQKVN